MTWLAKCNMMMIGLQEERLGRSQWVWAQAVHLANASNIQSCDSQSYVLSAWQRGEEEQEGEQRRGGIHNASNFLHTDAGAGADVGAADAAAGVQGYAKGYAQKGYAQKGKR
jgi:hypothetical protein